MSLIELTPAVGGRDVATWVSQSFLSRLFRIFFSCCSASLSKKFSVVSSSNGVSFARMLVTGSAKLQLGLYVFCQDYVAFSWFPVS